MNLFTHFLLFLRDILLLIASSCEFDVVACLLQKIFFFGRASRLFSRINRSYLFGQTLKSTFVLTVPLLCRFQHALKSLLKENLFSCFFRNRLFKCPFLTSKDFTLYLHFLHLSFIIVNFEFIFRSGFPSVQQLCQ